MTGAKAPAPKPRWIVTGPAGAGKSTVIGLLQRRGALVVDGDRLGHALLREPDVIAAVSAAFGPAVLRDGAVDRGALGRLVFADPEALRRLDAIMLPRLAPRMRAALDDAARTAPRLAVLEAAVYFLLSDPLGADLVIVVTADPGTRVGRLVAAGRCSEAEARRRIAAQEPLEPHWRRADVVIENEGDPAALAAAVERLLAERLPA